MAKRILIIDDDMELSSELAEILSDEGHQVQARLFSKDELASLDPSGYDVIILDFKMPGINGADVLKAISTKNSRAKIFILSGKPFVEKVLKKEKVAKQVTEILQKPFSIQALLKKVNSA
jgi:DNA-binding NtrC family response regulator